MSKDGQTPENDVNEDLNGAESNEESGPSLEQELAKAKADYLYLAADFENFRKNAIKERSDLVKFGNERLLRELLEVVDNFERALESDNSETSSESLKSGVQMIFSELNSLIQRFGVREVETLGKPFDPNTHEALSSEPTSEFPPGHVARVFKKAYKFNDRLLRPAQVVVAVEPTNRE
jgi:molecular chaperone GrpE